jgi:hypothetical protein
MGAVMSIKVIARDSGGKKKQVVGEALAPERVSQLTGRSAAGLPLFLQPKLAISRPGDPAEVEADRVADQVMRMREPVVQRQCAACEEEEAVTVSRKAQGAIGSDAPASVGSVIGSPGQPLASSARAFFEPRFGQDLRHVRVHTDREAQQSARDVNALAYTVGSHVVFGTGRYAPGTSDGQRLLAHELTHVVQQQAMAEVVARTVAPGSTNCVAGTHGATPNPIGQLEWLEAMAASKAYLTSSSLMTEVAMAHIGTRGPGGRTTQAYQARFGMPPARRGGFRDRITGNDYPMREEALDAEMTSLSARYERIADYLSNRSIAYRCMERPVTYADCSTHCRSGRIASACAGVNAIFLCPGFWGRDPGVRIIAIIHEAAHILWSSVDHAANFRHAECYASFVGDLFGGTGAGPACPAP